MKRAMLVVIAASAAATCSFPAAAGASGPGAGANVRVTNDQGSSAYVSADQLGGTGNYSDATLARCSTDRRPQNEPTLAIDPRDPSVWVAGANDLCALPLAGDGWAGYYRSTDSGAAWTDSLLPGYSSDNSPQATTSPLHQSALAGAKADGDPSMAFDGQGRLFYMTSNFNRGHSDGDSPFVTGMTGEMVMSTYGPSDPLDPGTDGSRFVRTVVLDTNASGAGEFNDKTAIGVDPVSGNVYAAWSSYHGTGPFFGGCNDIMFSRSTDHGATFSKPLDISDGICKQQGPAFAIGPNGEIYLTWGANVGGNGGGNSVTGGGNVFVASTDHGVRFGKPRFVSIFNGFGSNVFSGNGADSCGDAPFNCPTGFNFPRWAPLPTIAADNVNKTIVIAYPVQEPSGQGQIERIVSSDGGATWSSPAELTPAATGHQFMPWLTASGGRTMAIWYDSQGDAQYSPTRPPCNGPTGAGYACLNVRYAQSTDGGLTWSTSIQVTSGPFNPNYEQYTGRHIPFLGDYITLAAAGNTIGATWTDQRDTVGAPDLSGDNDGDDIAGDPETGGSCTSALTTCFDLTGGGDANIYSARITP